MLRSTLASATAISAVVSAPSLLAAQRSDLAISPFVAFLPTAGSNPLAGIALTIAGDGGLGIRASARMAMQDSPSAGFGASTSIRPWGADADAVLSFGGRENRFIAPFVFAGIGTASRDSAGFRAMRSNWSYGAGGALPLSRAIDLFGEARWRMSRYVLPTADDAPAPTSEVRVGVSFHVGNNRSSDARISARGRRTEMTPSVMLRSGRLPSSSSATRVSGSTVRLLGTAEQYLGVRYRYGGTSPTTGFDCSGFVQYVFARQGVYLPRTALQQAQVGTALSPDWRGVSAGDLVMFEQDGRIGHVAIYAGDNRIIHSTSSGGGVRYDDLSTPRGQWFVDHMVAARRVTPDARGRALDLTRGFASGGPRELDGPDHAPRPRS